MTHDKGSTAPPTIMASLAQPGRARHVLEGADADTVDSEIGRIVDLSSACRIWPDLHPRAEAVVAAGRVDAGGLQEGIHGEDIKATARAGAASGGARLHAVGRHAGNPKAGPAGAIAEATD
jgi:hypothetical protein